MRRMPIRHRTMSFPRVGMPPRGLRGISRDFSRLSPCGGQVAYVLLTRAPVAGRSQQADSPAAPRLACVKPVASVHPEPGSNSSLLYLVFFFFSCFEYAAPRLAPRQLARHSRSTQHRLSEPRRSRIASFYCVYFFSMTCLVLNSSS